MVEAMASAAQSLRAGGDRPSTEAPGWRSWFSVRHPWARRTRQACDV